MQVETDRSGPRTHPHRFGNLFVPPTTFTFRRIELADSTLSRTHGFYVWKQTYEARHSRAQPEFLRIEDEKNNWTTLVCNPPGAIAAVPALADTVLYDNGTASSYTTQGYEVSGVAFVTDSFTLAQASVVDGANFGIWLLNGTTLTGLDWKITNSANHVLASGSATDLDGPLVATVVVAGVTDYNIYSDSTSIADLLLGAGTYYLELYDATSTSVEDQGEVFWDVSNGSSTAADLIGSAPSETFEILGPSAATPEPSGILLLGTGLAGFGGFLRRRLIIR
jgi:hypothetical protein